MARCLVYGDAHGHPTDTDLNRFARLAKFIDKVKPDIVINMGDD